MKTKSKINRNLLRRIIYNRASLWEEGLLTHHDPQNSYREEEDFEVVEKMLWAFYHQFDTNGVAQIQYKPSVINPHGRLFSTTPSLQGLCRRIRHTVSEAYDFDIVNCHPKLLPALCEANDLPHQWIDHYITNRKEVLKEIGKACRKDREEVKKLILKQMNGGDILADVGLEPPEVLQGLIAEFTNILKKVPVILPHHYKRAQTIRGVGGYNVEGSALNYWLCEKENALLQKMVVYVADKKEKDKSKLLADTLCFDGLLLRGVEDTILMEAELSNAIGMEVKFKPMNENIPLDYLNDFVPEEFEAQYQEYINTMAPDNTFNLPLSLTEAAETEKPIPFLNPDKKREKQTEDDIDICLKAGMMNTRAFADAFMNHCKETDRFIYVNGQKPVWYECDERNQNRWKPSNRPLLLMRMIGDTLRPLVAEKIRAMFTSVSPDKEKQIKSAYAILNGVDNIAFCRQVCERLQYDLLDKINIEASLDSHKGMIAFENGVLNCATREFRDILPTDLITKSTGYHYTPERNLAHQQFLSQELVKIFCGKHINGMIVPEEHPEAEYQLVLIASCMKGDNDDQQAYIFTGCGSNGKSVDVNLISATLGSSKDGTNGYVAHVNITNFTSKETEKGDLQKARGALVVVSSEPAIGSKFNMSLIKTATGREPISVRQLYSNPITYTPMFRPIFLTNNIPTFDYDEGAARRFRVVMFRNKFVDKPVNSNEFQKDLHIEDLLIQMKMEFFHMCLDRYNKPLITPPSYAEATTMYIENQDTTAMFLQGYRVSRSNEPGLPIMGLWKTFKEGYPEVNMNKQCFLESMARHGHTPIFKHRTSRHKVFLLHPQETEQETEQQQFLQQQIEQHGAMED